MRKLLFCSGGLVMLAMLARIAAAEETVEDLLKQATKASAEGRIDEAIRLAGAAIKVDPQSVAALMLRGRLQAEARQFAAAVRDYDTVLKLDPDAVDVLYWRGRAHFCAGKVAESVADFDRYVKLRPKAEPRLWERGLSLYYAGRAADGAAQFALYQTYYDNDVENVTWRYVCMAKSEGVEKARAKLLPVRNDARVPMMQVYALFQGKATPEDVLKAADAPADNDEEAKIQKFYAHLYLGLFYEAGGNAAKAKEHILKAQGLKISHYMWDVANVHAQRLMKRSPDGSAPK